MIVRLDHLVLTVADVEATAAFYRDALGMEIVRIEGRTAVHFGRHKINLHQAGREFEPKAVRPTLGSGDFCLIVEPPLSAAEARLRAAGVAIEEGPVARTGAEGPITSLYFRDPDGNLVEVSTYDEAAGRSA